MHLRATLYTPSTESNYLSFNQTRGCRTHSEALQNSEIETRVSEAKQPKNPTTSFCFPRRHSSKASLPVRISCPSLLIPPILPAIQMDSVPPIDVESSREYSWLSFTPLIRRYGNPLPCQIHDLFFFFPPPFVSPSFPLFFAPFIFSFSFGSGEKSFLRKIYRYFLLCFGIGCLRVSVRHVARTVLFVFEQDLVLLSFVFTLGNEEKFHACLLLMFRLQYAREQLLFFAYYV